MMFEAITTGCSQGYGSDRGQSAYIHEPIVKSKSVAASKGKGMFTIFAIPQSLTARRVRFLRGFSIRRITCLFAKSAAQS
jgi:hypothetical protein